MKNNKQAVAVFGGSFNPPHFGHIDIVKNLERKFDRVIVVPSYISPFKTSDENDKPDKRVALCKKVFSSEKTEICRYEMSKKAIGYSVDTATYLAKKTGAPLFWVIGSEELSRLEDWRDIDRLKTLVTFYVVHRPNYEIDNAVWARLKKRKIKLKLAPFAGLDISSTAVKLDFAFKKPSRFVPSSVLEYAQKYEMFDSYARYTRDYVKYGLSPYRIGHIYRTALRGAELAKLYGGSVRDAVIACLLHDIAKDVDIATYSDKCDLSRFPPETEHAAIGAYIAKTEYGVSDEIEHAIYVHTMGDCDMSLLDEIVYLADKTEEGRRYRSLEYVRYLCSVDKNLAMLYAIGEINGLGPKTPPSDEWAHQNVYASRAYEYYRKKCGDVELPKMPERSAQPEKVERQKKEKKTAKSENPEKAFVSSGDVIKDIALAAAYELSQHKARNIDIVDLGGKTIIADYFVIASVTSSTAVKALMGYVEDRLTKQFGLNPNKRDINNEWIALDYGSVIVHIFTEKTRAFYNIERLWADGKNITRYED